MTIFTYSSLSSPNYSFMQDPKDNSSHTRKPWYRRAIDMTKVWKLIVLPKVSAIPTKNGTLLRTMSKAIDINPTSNNSNNRKLRKSTSMRVATSFTRVCLCAPISSYTEVFQVDVPHRRSYSYPRLSSKPLFPPSSHDIRSSSARMSIEGTRRIFRGKSLTDDVLMRRFVIEEEAMIQMKRRNQMEIIRKRSAMRKKRLGPSPLSRMALAEEC